MFGMGTGGSLRLLSPETKLSLDAFAAAFLVSSVRPSIGLPTSFQRFRFRFSALRALALSRFAPSKPHRVDSLPPDQGVRSSFETPHKSVLPGFRSAFGSDPGLSFQLRSSLCLPFHTLSCSLLPTPYSLLLRSSPRPISIIKLHTLPHFHR